MGEFATQHFNFYIANLLHSIIQTEWVPKIIDGDTIKLYYAVEHCVEGWDSDKLIREMYPSQGDKESFLLRHKENIERY